MYAGIVSFEGDRMEVILFLKAYLSFCHSGWEGREPMVADLLQYVLHLTIQSTGSAM